MEDDEPQQPQQEKEEQEEEEVVGPSQPSTSADPDLVFNEHLVQSYEAGYYSDDPSPQVSDELTVPLIGDKVATGLTLCPRTSVPDLNLDGYHADNENYDDYDLGDTSDSVSTFDTNYTVDKPSDPPDDNYDDYDLGDTYDDEKYDPISTIDANYGLDKPNDPPDPFFDPFVSEKEPLSVLASQLQGIMQEKAVLLTEKYAALRRSRGDGSCFFRSFMFSYLEHILVTQDRAEVERILIRIEQSRAHLYNLGYAEFTYEDFFTSFTELLESCLSGTEASLSPDELLEKACDQNISNNGVMFLRFITSAEIQNRADFFAPFIADLNISIAEFCKKKVEPMKEESEQMQLIALSDALGVPIRVVYLDSKPLTTKDHTYENYHDFCPSAGNNITNKADAADESTGLSKQEKRVPFVTLLYRPGHYDILYPI